MVLGQIEQAPGLRILFTLAVVVILIYGLRLTQPIAQPFALAIFLAVINLPIVFWLEKKGVPLPGAISLTVLAVVGVLGLLGLLVSQQIGVLQERVPEYVEDIQMSAAEWLDPGDDTDTTSVSGLPAPDSLAEADSLRLGSNRIEPLSQFTAAIREYLLSLLEPRTLTSLAGSTLASFGLGTLTRTVSLLGSTFLVLLILVFALGEAAVFPRKLRAVAGDRVAADERLTKIIGEVHSYLVMKSLVSLGTGVLVGLWTWALGVDFPILLGLIAFVLNYVPTIGSVIAAGPALLLAFLESGLQHVAIVAVGYLVVNVVFGNWLEPTLIGRRLGLSTLVVILSLVFWGWLWGPVGALLSVPLTMVVKIMLENTRDLKWVAVLLDKNPPPEPAGESAS